MLLQIVTLQQGFHNDKKHNGQYGQIVLPASYTSPESDCGDTLKYAQDGFWAQSAPCRRTIGHYCSHEARTEDGQTVCYIAVFCYDQDFIGKNGAIDDCIVTLCETMVQLPESDKPVGLILNPACFRTRRSQIVEEVLLPKLEEMERNVIWFHR